MQKIKLLWKPVTIIFLILLFDQIFKFWIKTHFYLDEEVTIIKNFFYLHFTENNGMAFGYEFGGIYGKLILSTVRVIAVIAIGWYLYILCKNKASMGLIVGFALILAGALGNIIDSLFYGLLFSQSTYFQTAEFLPDGGGYGTFLYGKVVDMLYFPVIKGNFPGWFPFWKNEMFIFFRPIFNISDSSITIGVIYMILFQRKFFVQTKSTESIVDNASENK
ncbi:MAG: lipoprotein signal peptidase [Bacteroidales bacterium]|nr:lipoprotein signal peptidase [Bacteroidales bacterium]